MLQSELLRGLRLWLRSALHSIRCRRAVIPVKTLHQEIHMADKQPNEFNTPTGKPFGDMTGSEKITWLGKCFVMLITGGFAFPNIFVE